MDAFYASVEQRDNPRLRGLPVIVGGPPDSRAVVCTASYEARRFGIHSAMACSKAYRLCPQAVFVLPRFEAYRAVSEKIREIFFEYTDLVEPLSLDEAYLDVTVNRLEIPYAVTIAKEIKRKIFERTHLTATAGVASGKFLAKVASGMNKPDGLTVIRPEEAESFLERLAIGKFYGVGKVTERRMKEAGIESGADLKKKTCAELETLFGKSGLYYYQVVRGIDDSPVVSFRERKSVGIEDTFERDIADRNDLMDRLRSLAGGLSRRLAAHGKIGRTLTLKIKYADFEQHTRSETTGSAPVDAPALFAAGIRLLDAAREPGRAVRLLGLTVSGFGGPVRDDDCGQLTLGL